MNSPLATTENDNKEIPSLLIPIANCKLVLPTVSVAEMIPYSSPILPSTDMPDWFLGHLQWRQTQVPMVSYERLNGEPLADIKPESQLIILNNTGVSADLPFFCMPTQGIPRLSRVAMNEISDNTAVEAREYDEMQVFVAGEQAVLPDVSKIEKVCAQLLGYL